MDSEQRANKEHAGRPAGPSGELVAINVFLFSFSFIRSLPQAHWFQMWRFRALESHLQTFELTWVERRTKFAITRVDWALWIACIAKREWWIKVLMRLSFSQFERAGVSSPDHSLAWFERSTVWFSFFSSSKWGPRINEGNLYCFSAHSARRQDGPGRASGVDLGLAKIDWEDQDSNKWAAGRSNSRLNWIVIQFAELIKAIWNLNCIQVEWWIRQSWVSC